MPVSQIKGLPKCTTKIFESKAKNLAKAWNRKLKPIDDRQLVSIIQTMLASPENYDSKAWKFAGIALSELHIRHWGKNNPEMLEIFKKALGTYSNHCFTSRSYTLETAGIKYDNKNKVFHPYAYSEVAKKIVKIWQESVTNKSFEEFVKEEQYKGIWQYLETHTITYLSTEERDKFRVSFDDDYVKIGKKYLKDDWYIFVLGGEPVTLYAGIKVKGKFHHTSFLGGAPVLCAGEFKVENGKIVRISLKSGHYRPVELHGEQLRRYLQREENLGFQKAYNFIIEPHDN